MNLSLIRSMTRSAVFELENGLCFRPAHPFTVTLNGETIYDPHTLMCSPSSPCSPAPLIPWACRPRARGPEPGVHHEADVLCGRLPLRPSRGRRRDGQHRQAAGGPLHLPRRAALCMSPPDATARPACSSRAIPPSTWKSVPCSWVMHPPIPPLPRRAAQRERGGTSIT